jgi:hypothetical protein
MEAHSLYFNSRGNFQLITLPTFNRKQFNDIRIKWYRKVYNP